MTAANEPIIYAGAMIISVIMMVIATTFSGGMLDSAYTLMELNHMRYQSAVATHSAVVQDQGYKLSNSDFWNNIDTTGSNYCVYDNGPHEFSYLGSDTEHVNFTGMRVISTYEDQCTLDPDNLAGDSYSGIIGTWLNLSAYPALYTSVGSPAKSEATVALPETLWE
jgi:hypothetical protein